MTKTTSIYLNLIRIIAALVVAYFHAQLPKMGGTGNFPYGPEAVMAFFVLSGFVIHYVAENKEGNIYDFLIARLSRLWSLLLPALAITPIFDIIGKSINPSTYLGWEPWLGFDNPILRLFASSIFLNEIWFTYTAPLSNGPIWSIAYEFTYYISFACFYFLKGKHKFLGVTICFLLFGPKIFLLIPTWIMGVIISKTQGIIKLNSRLILMLFFSSILLLIFIHTYKLAINGNLYSIYEVFALAPKKILGNDIYENLKYSREFIALNIVGIIISLNIFSIVNLENKYDYIFTTKTLRIISKIADYTFPIYIFHHPIQLMLSSILYNMQNSHFKASIIFLVSVTISAILGFVFKSNYRNMKNILGLAAKNG